MPRKKTSKRLPSRIKVGVEKKVKEHKRKMKKMARQHPELLQRKSKKDPGIPNLWPFKEQLLKQMQKEQEKEVEYKQRIKDQRNREIEKRRELARKLASAAIASGSAMVDLAPEEESEEKLPKDQAGKRRWYFKELKSVIEQSDVILEVLDARDPMGCRATDIEKRILSQQSPSGHTYKRVILVLNKIDLIPPEVAEKWVRYLRREFPCVAFKSSTQESGRVTHHQAHARGKLDLSTVTASQLQSSGCLGAGALMQLLKNYCRSHNIKTAINVGVIGYPNVGKSSIINSLKRQRAVNVGAAPGVTKTVQQVKLDKHINLLDSPGVLFGAGNDDQNVLLRNAVKVQEIVDPVGVVNTIVSKCSADHLCKLYKIARFEDVDEFIRLVGERRGITAKGGVTNSDLAARVIISDWNAGKIPFYSLPPKKDDIVSSEVVTGWQTEFDIEKFLERTDRETFSELAKESKKSIEDFTVLQSSESAPMGLEDDDEDDKAPALAAIAGGDGDEMDQGEKEEEGKGAAEEEDKGEQMIGAVRDGEEDDNEEKEGKASGAKPVIKLSAADENNPQFNREIRRKQKALKKKARKQRSKSTAAAEEE